MNDVPDIRLPDPPVRAKDDFSASGLPPRRANAGAVGLWAGVQIGFFLGCGLGAIGVAASGTHARGDVSILPIIAWLLGGTLLGGVSGWAAGLLLGPTQKELARSIAGAAVGVIGGIIYSPLLGRVIPPMKDPTLETLRRTVIGGILGLVLGAACGLFYQYLRYRRRYSINGQRYVVPLVEQELLDEIDTRNGVRSSLWN